MLQDLAESITIGTFMILATFLIHAYSLDRLLVIIRRLLPHARDESSPHHHTWQMMILLLTGFGTICIHSLEIWLWAFLYLYLDIQAVRDLETSIYFSMVSFTTVGYGDVVLEPYDRILSGMQATSGMLLFGWSTAYIFEVISVTYNRLRIRS
jgi:voltage-gated potassium channel